MSNMENLRKDLLCCGLALIYPTPGKARVGKKLNSLPCDATSGHNLLIMRPIQKSFLDFFISRFIAELTAKRNVKLNNQTT
jgi:hypothetical protein